ncbi:MAG TPA: aminodeoxychorismate lyase [Methylophilaceae bacterium]|nr:aminodeoxychorismate lyase [Methylophilaceae bacterium]
MPTTTNFLINGDSGISLSPLDRGFFYGDGAFRTMKVSRGSPRNWSLHYQKLFEDCQRLLIPCPAADLFLADMYRLFTPDEEAVAKVVVTRGVGPRGYRIPETTTPTRIVIRETHPAYPSVYVDEGVRLHLCQLRLSHQPQLAGIKHLNRLENVLARSEWADVGIVDGVLLDQDNSVIECTMSNIFACFGYSLVTPSLNNCGVAGVTRQRILDNAEELGYEPVIRSLSLEELMTADEVIICNSLIGAWQVRSFNNRDWPHRDLANRVRSMLQD